MDRLSQCPSHAPPVFFDRQKQPGIISPRWASKIKRAHGRPRRAWKCEMAGVAQTRFSACKAITRLIASQRMASFWGRAEGRRPPSPFFALGSNTNGMRLWPLRVEEGLDSPTRAQLCHCMEPRNGRSPEPAGVALPNQWQRPGRIAGN
jgi:hypothetical protein